MYVLQKRPPLIFNLHSSYEWATSNPYALQEWFSIKVWVGIVNDFIISPHLLPNWLNGRTHLIFLEEVLPKSLHNVPVAVRNTMWFQDNEALAPSCNKVYVITSMSPLVFYRLDKVDQFGQHIHQIYQVLIFSYEDAKGTL